MSENHLPPPKNLQNKMILLTGASRNIGYQLALLLAKSGAQLLLNARTIGGLEQLDDEICDHGGLKPVLIPFDLTEFEHIDAMGLAISQRFGRLDGAVLNAATLTALMPLAHITPEQWDETFQLNCTANYRLIRALEPLLKLSANAVLFGIIDNQPEAFWGHYHASKLAFKGLLQCYRAEMSHSPLNVGYFHPQPTDTQLRSIAYPGEDKSLIQTSAQSAQDLYTQFVQLYD